MAAQAGVAASASTSDPLGGADQGPSPPEPNIHFSPPPLHAPHPPHPHHPHHSPPPPPPPPPLNLRDSLFQHFSSLSTSPYSAIILLACLMTMIMILIVMMMIVILIACFLIGVSVTLLVPAIQTLLEMQAKYASCANQMMTKQFSSVPD
eukprot:767141-Hanusia_phi.AAC.14